MEAFLFDAEVVKVLSRISGRPLNQEDLSPLVVFLTALVVVLRGVIVIDRVVAIAEEKQLQNTLNSFLPAEGNLPQLIPLIVAGVEKQQVYLSPVELLVLTSPLSQSQKLLLLALGYQMSAADADIDVREQMYLQSIANRLGIKPQHSTTLSAGLTGHGHVDPKALAEVYTLLDPAHFEHLDPVFVQVASNLRSALPAVS